MSSIGPKPVGLRLNPVAYESLRQLLLLSRWLALSVVRHNGEPGSPSQGILKPLGPRLRTKPDHALLRVPRLHPPLKIMGVLPRRTLCPHQHFSFRREEHRRDGIPESRRRR